MAKAGLILILLGLGCLILKFFSFELSFLNYLGETSTQVWILLGMSALGALLLFAGFMTER